MGTAGATGRKDAGAQISRLQPQFSEAVESVRTTFRFASSKRRPSNIVRSAHKCEKGAVELKGLKTQNRLNGSRKF